MLYFNLLAENKPKAELIKLLVRRGYDSDPVKAWKHAQDKLMVCVIFYMVPMGASRVGESPDFH